MEYEYLTASQKAAGVQQRIVELEGEHFSNTVYLFEAKIIGAENDIRDFTTKNQGLEKRIAGLKEMLKELTEELVSEEEDGTNS
jgi:hypothetical protein